MKNILLLMMGGSGTRFGADIPKQYVEIDGVPVFAYILEKYSKMKEIDEVVAVPTETGQASSGNGHLSLRYMQNCILLQAEIRDRHRF